MREASQTVNPLKNKMRGGKRKMKNKMIQLNGNLKHASKIRQNVKIIPKIHPSKPTLN